MNRRYVLTLLAGAVLGPAAAQADPLVDSVVRQLREQGYSPIRVSRTLLGRLRFVASRSGAQREIIINPRTGELLRDYTEGKSGIGQIADEGDDDDDGYDHDDDDRDDDGRYDDGRYDDDGYDDGGYDDGGDTDGGGDDGDDGGDDAGDGGEGDGEGDGGDGDGDGGGDD